MKEEEFKTRLARALTLRNIKPAELSEKTGILKSSISQYLHGDSKPNSDAFTKITQVLNVNPTWLSGYAVPMEIISSNNDSSIRTTDTNVMFPIVGKVSAGLPILAVENIEGYEVAPSSYVKHGFEYFYLRVQGDSMDIKIPEGSLVLVQKQDALENDEIGVFRINNDDVTVKKFKKEDNMISLIPMSHNPIHKNQKYDLTKDKIDIVGRVVFYIGKL